MNFYNLPFIEIIEQPASSTRFRYTGENRIESLLGKTSTKTKKTYFKIKIHNLQTLARVSVSCVSKEPPHYVHPHSLQVKDQESKKCECINGIIYFDLTPDDPSMEFTKIGIRSCRKNEQHYFIKSKMFHDPCNAGPNHPYFAGTIIDLTAVRLAIQAVIKLPMMNNAVPLETVITDIITDSKIANDEMKICSVSHDSVPASGGKKIIILTERIYKNDIQVLFYELNDELDVIWEAPGEFEPEDVHYQRGITLKTPAYKNKNIDKPVTVYIQLTRPSNQSVSELHKIEFYPDDESTDVRKRKRSALGNSTPHIDINSCEGCTCVNCPVHVKQFDVNYDNHINPTTAIDKIIDDTLLNNDIDSTNFIEDIINQNYNELSKTSNTNPDNLIENEFHDELILTPLEIENANNQINIINNYQHNYQIPTENVKALSKSLTSIKITSVEAKEFDKFYS